MPTRDDLFARVFAGIFTHWHWFSYHFERKLRGQPEPFAEAIIDACFEIESALPGFGYRTIDRLLALSGVEKHEPHSTAATASYSDGVTFVPQWRGQR